MAKGRKTGGRTKGNPNRLTREVRQYASKFTKEAVLALVHIGRDAEAPHAARVAAWREVLDRGPGRPPQAVTGADGEAMPFPTEVHFVFPVDPEAENQT